MRERNRQPSLTFSFFAFPLLFSSSLPFFVSLLPPFTPSCRNLISATTEAPRARPDSGAKVRWGPDQTRGLRRGTCTGAKTGFSHFSEELSDRGCSRGGHCPRPQRGTRSRVTSPPPPPTPQAERPARGHKGPSQLLRRLLAGGPGLRPAPPLAGNSWRRVRGGASAGPPRGPRPSPASLAQSEPSSWRSG